MRLTHPRRTPEWPPVRSLSSYTAAVERYLTSTAIPMSSAQIYRVSLRTWGWMPTGEPAPTGPLARARSGSSSLVKDALRARRKGR